ncbi:MAG: hypothetical protein WA746_25465 [Isosphaeraceae bacterium]
MLAIKCPACGAEGRASKEKIQTRLVCRKCLRVFHVTPSGKTVLGEPPAPGQTSTAVSRAKAAPDPVQKVDQWFDRASKRFFLPTSLILTVGLILLAVAGTLFTPRRPESLQDRVARVAKAAVEGDLQTIRELAATGTAGSAVTWCITIRPQCDELMHRLGSRKLAVETEVKQQDPQEWADVVAHVSPEEKEELERRGNALPDASIVLIPTSQPVSLHMAWTSEGWWAGWRLDGNRTLELFKAQP